MGRPDAYFRRQPRSTGGTCLRPEPYAADHTRSIERAASRGVEPRSLTALIRWFRPRWEAETPIRLHSAGVWRSRPDEYTPSAEVGGSLLGTPQLSPDFRRLIENSACEIDRESGDFVRPARAALYRLGLNKPRTAERLTRFARGGWDINMILIAERLDPEDGEILLREGLRLWWREFEERPTTR
jgi:hypothetical protein